VLEGHARGGLRAAYRGTSWRGWGVGRGDGGLAGRFDDHGEEIRALVALNQEFHGAIVEASRNKRLFRLINRTVEIPLMFKAFFWYTPHERVISNHYTARSSTPWKRATRTGRR
jgi:hypothetical protein